MKEKRYLIFAALAFASLLCSCTPEDKPKELEESYPVGFFAHTPATKSASLKDSFSSGDAIKVYGKRNHSEQVFNGQIVTKGTTAWSYSPEKYWNWKNSTDSYSFLAVYPTTSTVDATDYQGHISVKVGYDYDPDGTVDQYDLMMAGQRRLYSAADHNALVPFEFKHMTSAVQVNFRNRTTSMSVTINSYCFRNLSTSGTAHSFFNAGAGGSYTLVQHWDDVVSGFNSTDEILTHEDVDETLDEYDGTTYDTYSGNIDLFIPQDLDYDAANLAVLEISYTPEGGEAKLAQVVLKDVQNSLGAAFTDTWEIGNKYIYNIDFNLDGGILVTVITTDWETIEAQTPGIFL